MSYEAWGEPDDPPELPDGWWDEDQVAEAKARIAALEATLKGIAEANFKEWDEGLNTAEEFVRWAKSRAAHALTPNK